jgi:hypothetical protein
MKLLKQSEGSNLFNLCDLTEDQLIAAFNVALNYGVYLEQITKLDNKSLLTLAKGTDVKTVRELLKLQETYCKDYIQLWRETTSHGGTNNKDN